MCISMQLFFSPTSKGPEVPRVLQVAQQRFPKQVVDNRGSTVTVILKEACVPLLWHISNRGRRGFKFYQRQDISVSIQLENRTLGLRVCSTSAHGEMV